MNNVVSNLEPIILIGSSSLLQVTRTSIKSWMGSKFGQIWTVGLAALEHLEKFPLVYNGRNISTTVVPSFLVGS